MSGKIIKTIADLEPDKRNANRGTVRGRAMLDHSLRTLGAGRSILTDKNGKVIAGNKTLEVAADIDLPIEVIKTRGDKLVVVQREDLDLETDAAARELAYADNRVSDVDLAWDVRAIAQDVTAGVDLSAYFNEREQAAALHMVADDILAEVLAASEDKAASEGERRAHVPDQIFPTDNDWGVPTLDITMQAQGVSAPVLGWGSVKRTSRNQGTWAFYIDDYRFSAVWDDPSRVSDTGCVAIIEPNYTISPIMPRAVALYAIYRKRYLARLWQQQGIRVFVDLNVCEPNLSAVGMLGVPQGWRAYATHGAETDPESTVHEWEIACQRAGTEDVLFLVYGGGRATKMLCQQRGWVFVPDYMGKRANGMREVFDGE